MGRVTVRDLDALERFQATKHVAGEHASLLTFACSVADFHDLNQDRFEVVGVTGNSMGWYTALCVAGALPLAQAARLVEHMAAYQARNVIGGQVIYPLLDGDWNESEELETHIDNALAHVQSLGHVAEWSIRLGGYAVLGGDRPGVKALLEALPPQKRGDRTFPTQLPMHSAFHTSLMNETSDKALQALDDLNYRRPDVPLIDGRGVVHRPHTASLSALREYTLGHQVTRPFDYTTAVESALTHCAPDVVVLLGPGNSLGGPTAQVVVSKHWFGVGQRQDLRSTTPEQTHRLLSFGVAKQREHLV
jgi:malonyl CoA-acyl carrier protein transacylase